MRKTTSIRVLTALSTLTLILLCAPPSPAADPLEVCRSGQPFLWPNGGVGIPFNPDQGDLGPLTQAQAVALTQQSFDNWGNLATTQASYVNAGSLNVDVDVTNFVPFFNAAAPDGFSAIVFDDTGEIFDAIFGPNSGVLGFAGPEFANTVTCEIIEGLAFLNGPEFTDLLIAEDIMTHEFGHYSNLAHVELNGQLVGFPEGSDDSGPSPQNTFGTPLFDGTNVIETMYPFFFGNIDQGARSPNADDVAAISTLYPAPNFLSTTGTISGTVLASDGVTRLTGVNVIARNISDPFGDAVSAISGGFSDSVTDQNDPVVGTYTLNGLTPGAQYVLFVDEITALAGRFSTPALQPLPGPEEFWNGANEAGTDPPDDPLDSVTLTAVAGSPLASTDIVFNAPAPGALELGDDDFVELPLPFDFLVCGQSFNSVFVNSNGSLTFGQGSVDFTESAADFLGGPPRIAGLWDDLSPNNGGTVSFSQDQNEFSVRFENVPEFFATGANTFEITLKRSSNQALITYGDLSAADGLAGLSCGSAVASGAEPEIELRTVPNRRVINMNGLAAQYENFTGGDNDLSNYELKFINFKRGFEDELEPNDSLDDAAEVEDLPFDTLDIFTAIAPTGGDIDFFELELDDDDDDDDDGGGGDQTLIIEIINGSLDSLIGLFDEDGNLLAIDDDSGPGLLSRIIFPITGGEVDELILAVTTFPDFDFTGAGASGGRYVVRVTTVDGILLNLGDDTSQLVNLGFSFPFQGQSFTEVFVNSNGNLTFGLGDTDFSESVGEFLAESPRIAPLWDDLSPNNGGSVIVDGGSGSLTVSFVDVPEFPSTGANNFSVTLNANGGIDFDYGAVSASDGLVGITQGNGAADPGETDLSLATSLSANGTTYEQFSFGGPFDLQGLVLLFVP